MTKTEAMKQLEKMGTAQNVKVYKRPGIAYIARAAAQTSHKKRKRG